MEETNKKSVDFSGLSTELLRGGNSIRFKALGSSMDPWIKDGDILTIQPVQAGELRDGQVVFYTSKADRPVVHRISEVFESESQIFIWVKGDASPKSAERIEATKALGKVVRIQRGSKGIQVDRNLWWRVAKLWPGFRQAVFLLVRFQRRFRRYIILSPDPSDRERGT
jgi:signal peptidase I